MSANPTFRSRRPAGTPTGGQFAPEPHAEPEVVIGALPEHDPELDALVAEFADIRHLLPSDKVSMDTDSVSPPAMSTSHLVECVMCDHPDLLRPPAGATVTHVLGDDGTVVLSLGPTVEDDPDLQYTAIASMPIALCDLKPAAEETSLDEAVRATVGNLRSEVESLVPAYERLYGAQSRSNAAALDRIATMLQDPEWGSGMLEDIAEEVQRTGRSLDGDGDPTWDRH